MQLFHRDPVLILRHTRNTYGYGPYNQDHPSFLRAHFSRKLFQLPWLLADNEDRPCLQRQVTEKAHKSILFDYEHHVCSYRCVGLRPTLPATVLSVESLSLRHVMGLSPLHH